MFLCIVVYFIWYVGLLIVALFYLVFGALAVDFVLNWLLILFKC